MLKSISGFPEKTAKISPQKTSIIYKEKYLTYKEFDENCNKIANALTAKGLKRGDKVIVSTKNKLWEALLCFGILKAGAIEIALDPADTTKNVNNIMSHMDARFSVTDKDDFDSFFSGHATSLVTSRLSSRAMS